MLQVLVTLRFKELQGMSLSVRFIVRFSISLGITVYIGINILIIVYVIID